MPHPPTLRSSILRQQYSKQALADIASEPRAALKPYARLRTIVGLLKDAQPAAEGAAPHLVDYTDKLASALRQQMKKYFGDRLQKTLEEMKWPTRQLNLTDQLLAQWRQDVELLIDLQLPYDQSLHVWMHILTIFLLVNFTAVTHWLPD
jgi:hypothetical protein